MEHNLSSEPLEEGEIVDDGFEDISDNSIIESSLGKFASPNENLRALPLSSDSETEIVKNSKLKRKLPHRKTRRKRKKPKVQMESSESEPECRDLKDKLKEAIHIRGLEPNCKSTLEAGLKAMGVFNTVAQPPPDTDALDHSDKLDDNDIESLRMEALRTAILNKYKRRKRKKILAQFENEEQKPNEAQDNKENNTPQCETKQCVETSGTANDKVHVNNAADLEEDEEVLRASLLAALAKKITKKPPPENIGMDKTESPKLPVNVTAVLPKPKPTFFTNKVLNKRIQNRPTPQIHVKPLIINLNGDSDSEVDDAKPKSSQPQNSNDLKVITNNVEKFLKEQRAKFENESKNSINVSKKDGNKRVLEKSAVKLLPKSQQIEYQQLLRRLKRAELLKRAKKLQQIQQNQKVDHAITMAKDNELNVEIIVEETNDAELIATLRHNEQPTGEADALKLDFDREQNSKENSPETGKPSVLNELTLLQKTLKEIKGQRNGSLQIKSKYQVLKSIIRKITVTSNERKEQEHRIKILIKELNEAKSSLSKSHEKFSSLVRELVDKKETIDKSLAVMASGGFMKIATSLATSTPIKAHENSGDEDANSSIVTNSTINGYEDMDICNSDETDVYQIDIVDPNDIDQIFKRRPPKSTIPEYISPLNSNSDERCRFVDPLGIMCPYEVNGSCRDIDCTFKHYLKKCEG